MDMVVTEAAVTNVPRARRGKEPQAQFLGAENKSSVTCGVEVTLWKTA